MERFIYGQMIKILFYTDTPQYGGAEKQMELLAKYLKPLGYEVSLACGKYSELKKHEEDMRKVYRDIFFLPTLHKHDPRHYSGLNKILADNHFDLIHIHLWNPGACRFAFFAAHKAGVPVIATEHDPFELSGLKALIKKKCIKKTDHIIAISLDNYRQLAQYDEHLKNRLHLINNGIEFDRFMDNMDKASMPVQHGEITLTCVAEFHKRKGHRYLFGAFEKLQKEFPTLNLVLVGKGPLEKEFKEDYGHNPNIHFLGWRDDIPQILRASDIFVLPSLKEAFGLSVVEAMASETAVIATDSGGVKDIIKHNTTGYLVQPSSSDAIADAIRALILNPDMKKDLESAALEYAKAHFTADIMARKTDEVYRLITKGRRDGRTVGR